MGVPVNDCRAGTLVWVQRKNGSWWPGRVLDPNDFSHSNQVGTPVKLLGKEDACVDWYDLEKSKRVKTFRCGEFDDCIGKAESSQASYSNKIVKYTHRVVAILQALELEKLEVKKKRKASGEERAWVICRGKRSRRVFVSDESNNCWNRATTSNEPSHALSTLKMHKYPLQSHVAEDDTSSRSTGPDSSGCGSIGRLQMQTQLSDAARVGANGSGNFGKHYVRSVNFYRKEKGEMNNFATSPPDHLARTASKSQNCQVQEKQGISNLTRRKMVLMDGKLVLRSSRDNSDKAADVVFTHRTETTLVDVELTVKIQCGRQHVPLVSLMSKTNGRAIVGHPVNIEELDAGSSDALLADEKKHGIVCPLLPSDNGGTTRTMIPTIWKTCRRTPVCYVPQASPPLSVEMEKLPRIEFQTKPLKKRPLPALTAVKGNNGAPNSVAVKLIFHKLLMAVGKA